MDDTSYNPRLDRQRHRLQMQQMRQRHPLQQLFWECTLRCNLSCRHCGSDCQKVETRPDMPLEDFLKVLDDLATHLDPHRVLVNTVGGEPLVRADLAECGREITRRGFAWGMVTNGYLLTREKLIELLRAGLRTIAVSLDGLEESHNWLRANPRSFERAMMAIDLLTHTRHLMWDVITCVSHKNLSELPALKEYLISHGVKRWRCTTIAPMGRAATNRDLQLTAEEYRALLDFIRETRKEGRIALNYSCEAYTGIYEGEVRDYLFGCQAGIRVASILADGSISGCLSIRSNYHQGNIYQDNFWEVWNTRFDCYRQLEWKRQGPCADCSCFEDCLGGAMHLRHDDGSLLICHHRLLKDAL